MPKKHGVIEDGDLLSIYFWEVDQRIEIGVDRDLTCGPGKKRPNRGNKRN